MAKGNRRNPKALPPLNSQPRALAVRTEQQSFSGPLPPPQILEHYNQIVPGCAEKIILQWEIQSRHRQDLEKKVVGSDIRQSIYGATLGFVIAMSAIGSGTFLAYIGRPTEGISAIITALVGLVGVYGWGSYQRRKERNLRVNQ